MRLTREFYRPMGENLTVFSENGLPGSEIYRYENSGGLCAAVFGGKRAKPDWRFLFPNEERRQEKIEEWIKGQKWRLEDAKKRRKERFEPHDFKVGQLFYCSWGYDQTNIDYYMLTELKAKTMGYIVPIGAKTVSSNPPQDMVAPDPDHIREWDVLLGKNQNDGPPEPGKWKRLTTDGFSMGGSHYHASPCEPDTARYETSSGWGH
jgi:hypothetical protein